MCAKRKPSLGRPVVEVCLASWSEVAEIKYVISEYIGSVAKPGELSTVRLEAV